MFGKRVTSPTGRIWVIRRRWAPRRPRWRGPVGKRLLDFGDFPVDIGEGILILVGVVAFVLFMIFLGLPLLIFLLDFVLIVILALAGIAARVLFRRPWTVEVTTGAPLAQRREWQVVGWGRSGALLAEIETRLVAGQTLEQLPADATADGTGSVA